MERTSPGEDAVYVETYAHDAGGRLVERRGDAIGVVRWEYFAPAPAPDARMAQDLNDDGLVEVESSSFHDRAGRQIFLSIHMWDGSVTTVAHEYGPTGDEVWALRAGESPDGGRFESET